MNARFDDVRRSWRNQRIVFGSYCAIGFLAALSAGAWTLPPSILQPLLAWARTLESLASVSWDPPAVASYFGLMLLLGVLCLVPMGIALASHSQPRPAARIFFFGLPLAAALAGIAYLFVAGWGGLDPDFVHPEATRAQHRLAMMVGSRLGLAIFGTIWMVTAMVLASIPITMVIVLVRNLRNDGTH